MPSKSSASINKGGPTPEVRMILFVGAMVLAAGVGMLIPALWTKPIQHPPTYIEVQCDALDVHLYPHNKASESDAVEFANELTDMRICRDQGVPTPVDHGAEG